MDIDLITVLLKRWHPETHIIHLPFSEATITLQNISILTGLSVDGEAVTGANPTLSIPEWQDMCYRLLRFQPDA